MSVDDKEEYVGEKRMRRLLLLFLVVSGACAGQQKEGDYDFELRIRAAKLFVELAVTPQKRRRGLMGRKSMPYSAGMLFVYPEERRLKFWMKNTHIPLSIAFIDSEGVILQIEHLKPLDETGVYSQKPARFALEVNRGWFRENLIGLGDRIKNISDVYKRVGMEMGE